LIGKGGVAGWVVGVKMIVPQIGGKFTDSLNHFYDVTVENGFSLLHSSTLPAGSCSNITKQ
jgi:hypothetical protein